MPITCAASPAPTNSAAWNAALDHGVQRLTDIAIDRATDGVPVPVFWRGEQVGEKRWYNDRLLMFILKHHLPRTYNPPKLPTGTRHPDTLRREWEEERAAEATAAGASVTARLSAIRSHFKRGIAADPAKRAAWELLTGPTDWSDFTKTTDYGWNPTLPDINQNRPDMIVTMAMPVGEDGATVAERLFGGGMGEDEDQASPA